MASRVGVQKNMAEKWYVLKGKRVLGPFSDEEVRRFLLLGRIRNSDRVSLDGELWEPLTQVPQLIPDELLDLQDLGRWLPEIFPREMPEK